MLIVTSVDLWGVLRNVFHRIFGFLETALTFGTASMIVAQVYTPDASIRIAKLGYRCCIRLPIAIGMADACTIEDIYCNGICHFLTMSFDLL